MPATGETAMLRTVAIVACLAAVPTLVLADDDTEYHFGFLVGTDIGDVGEKEIESRLEGRFGKRVGTYNALFNKVEAEFVPWRDFRFSVAASAAYHDIVGVPGLDDRNKGRSTACRWGSNTGCSIASTRRSGSPSRSNRNGRASMRRVARR